MRALTEQQIRSSLVNASRSEVADLALPLNFDSIDWDRLDYLGWRDRKAGRRAYVITWFDEKPVGVLLQQTGTLPRHRAQCSWCDDILLSNEVVFYGAKRSGEAGRRGNSIGTLICGDFGCSATVRARPALAYVGFDLAAAREQRMASLRKHVEGFVHAVLGD